MLDATLYIFTFKLWVGGGDSVLKKEIPVKLTFGLIFAGCLLSTAALAQLPVNLTIETNPPESSISPGFIGFSFETGSLRYGRDRKDGYFFDSSNTQLITLFRNLGVRSLRIGGNSVEEYTPSTKDIDALFRFAKAAGVKVIYSLPLAKGGPDQDASIAKYLWEHYRDDLISIAIGNEPDEYKVNGQNPAIRDYSSYLAAWKKLASAVIGAVPDVRLDGPDTDGWSAIPWTSAFAQAEQDRANASSILYHFKPLGGAGGKTTEQLAFGELSPDLDGSIYPAGYYSIGAMAQSYGFSYRFTEFNDWVAPRQATIYDYSFASGLFALDALHWWAAHECRSVHFHVGIHGFHAAFFVDPAGNYQLYPLSYGIAAFNLGGHGKVDSLKIDNPDDMNLTAYAVTDAKNNLFVTIINKEHGAGARDASLRINAIGKKEGVMYLKAPNHDVTETSGITLGGTSIDGSARWQANWSPLDSKDQTGSVVNVGASSAAIVEFSGPRITTARKQNR